MMLIANGFAQTGTSVVSGTVRDSQGNVVPGATVTLLSDKGASRTATANSGGTYSFPSLSPGAYRIEVEAQGFKKAAVSEFQALTDLPVVVNVSLEVGQVSETVNVQASSIESIVNTQDASLGNNFVSQQIQQLPLNARNVGDLLSLQAGVTPDGSVSGSRSDQANITLDGVDVNEQVNGNAFSPVLRVNPDSVDEFRVTTQNADASKGRSSGAQISLITKAGNNEFQGALYEYYRGPRFTANDWINNAAGRDRPGLIRHLFGGRLGGPIVKDKLFFFYNYEALRESKSSPVNRLVPLASMGQGQLKFRDAGGAVVTVSTAQINALTGPASLGSPSVVDVNPATVALFAAAAAKYPANNTLLGDGLNTGGFSFNSLAPVEQNTHTGNFTYNVNAAHTLSLRGNYQQDLLTGVSRFPDTPGTNRWGHPLGISAKHTWIIKNNLVNNFTYGLTRNAFSTQGDSSDDAITFGNQFAIFTPYSYARTSARVTPVHNFTDDVSWVKGNHTFQFGMNLRFVKNRTDNFARAFDNAVMNETFYATSGTLQPHIPLQNALGITIPNSQIPAVRSVLTSLWGRFTQYTANYNFNLDGTAQAPRTPVTREYATEEYDGYFQDVWKVRSNVTVTAGLRYGISMPIHETQGFETRPNVSLSEYLQKRITAASNGQNYTEPISVILSGKANNAPRMYPVDKNNWQPRLAAAWSPNFESGWLASLFGEKEESVFRGGFAITNDYFGQSLALGWDANNTLGFSASSNINFATYTIYQSGCTVAANCNPGPQFTGLNQTIRSLPNLTEPAAATFPQTLSNNLALARIQSSLDTDLVSPVQYSFNFSYGRKLPWGMYLDASYQGRLGRNLFASRDIMQLNNIRDPTSGQTWDEAARILEGHRLAGTPIAQIQNLPWFENMYAPGTIDGIYFGAGLSNTRAAYAVMSGAGPNTTAPDCGTVGGCYGYGIDWTFMQQQLDRFSGRTLFMHPQYGALAAYGTIGSSDYHGAAFTIRQRMSGLTWDLNYTWSKSMDDASGLNNATTYSGGSFILNALRQEDFRSVSDFDLRHVINANAVWDIPIGKGRTFLSNTNKFVDAVIGGWTMSGIFRYNTGYPFAVSCVGGWPANWQRNSYCVRNEPIQTSPTKAGLNPNNFTDPVAAYRSFRSPGPGESGDRNSLRLPSFIVLDMGMQKSFGMPWNEKHFLKLRVDAFNVTNTQKLTGFNAASLNTDPQFGTPPTNWGNLTAIQGTPRILQWAVRYEF
ncbi:MAG TPA: TonB-dependent receptor [Pyrinomonadaceae bacterium]|nr:TonB-dependent receptor [Pyrinomonadaceae bacterium]